MKKGFTLVELLVSMAISSVVFMLVGSTLALFVTQNTRSQRQEIFEQAKNDLAVEMTNDVKWSKSVSFGLDFLQTDSVQYRIDNGNLLKNGTSLLQDKLAVTRFEITDRSAAPGLVSLEINIELEDRSYPIAKDGLHLVVSQRKTDISF